MTGWELLAQLRQLADAQRPPPFVCPVCAAVSHHPADREHGYCGRCHAFTGNPPGNTPGPVS